jgi:hypothetical protein
MHHHTVTCRPGESVYKTTLCHNPKDSNLMTHHHGNLGTYGIPNTGCIISPLLGAVLAHNIMRSDIEEIQNTGLQDLPQIRTERLLLVYSPIGRISKPTAYKQRVQILISLLLYWCYSLWESLLSPRFRNSKFFCTVVVSPVPDPQPGGPGTVFRLTPTHYHELTLPPAYSSYHRCSKTSSSR